MKCYFFCAVLSYPFFFSAAQQCPENFAGTKTLYQLRQPVYTKPPAGYQPVFINHVGRHGARHLTKDVNTSFAYALLQKADSMQGLNANGKKLKEMVLLLEKVEKEDFKSISNEGIRELNQIATRMYSNFIPVFLTKPFTAVNVTKEKRTQQSASVFVNRLKQLLNRKDSVYQVINDTTLRFYDISPAYLKFEKEGNWQQSVEHLEKSLQLDMVIEKTGHLFFTTSFFTRINKKELREFTADIFGFITILPSIEKEIGQEGYNTQQLNFQSFYNCDDLLKLGQLDNAEDFLLKGPGTGSTEIQVKIAAPLLMDFIMATDDFINKGGTAVRLRFAHAETIAPFAALLNIRGAAEPAANIDSFSRYWKAEEIVPLSANIQWILYRKDGSNDYLLKILLNEKETEISGLETKTFPFYSWNKARDFYLAKLNLAGLHPGDDFSKYLLKVK